MPRVTVTPGRDLGKPLVKVSETASVVQKSGLWMFRGYLVFVVIIGVLCVIAGVVFLLTL
jgi:hypothetical protein